MSDHNQHIDQKTFELYLSGKLSPEEQYKVERQLEASNFEREAMEGLESLPIEDWKNDLDQLNKNLSQFKAQNKTFNWYSIAAVIALLIVSSWAVWIFVDDNESNLALQQENKVEENQSPKETSKPGTALDSLENKSSTVSGEQKESNVNTEPLIEVTRPNNNTTGSTGTNKETNPTQDQIALLDEEIEEVEEELELTIEEENDFYADESDAALPVLSEVNEEIAVEEINEFGAGESAAKTEIETKEISSSESEKVLRRNRRSKSLKKEMNADDNLAQVESSTSGNVASDNNTATAPLSTATRAFNNDDPQKSISESEYLKYLEENLVYPDQAKAEKVEGTVKLIFTVNADSTTTDFIILQGIGSGCDEEAIRLVKEGPKWYPPIRAGKPIITDGFQEIQFFLEKK